MGAELLVPLAAVGALIIIVVLTLVWVRAEVKHSAKAEAQSKVDMDALEALQRGEQRATEIRSLDRHTKFDRLQHRADSRNPKGVPGNHDPGGSGAG